MKPRKPLKRIGKRGLAKRALMKELKAKYPGDCQLNRDAYPQGEFLEAVIDLHHKVLAAQGGKTEPDNLVRLCRRCHSSAHLDFSMLERIRKSGANLLNGDTI